MLEKGRVSIIIPTAGEVFLNKTINDLLEHTAGDVEIIVGLDGIWPDESVNHPKVHYFHPGRRIGMREIINAAATIARGEYLMKLDGHCMVDEGIDITLKSEIDDNWIVIPRRKRLDADTWTIQEVGKPDVDYEYISHPSKWGIKGGIWTQRIIERTDPKFNLDENMTFQGSCWFMKNTHYNKTLGGMQSEGYGTFVRESQEIGLKTWLGGGKVMTNKKTWYAHLHKGTKHGRGYFLNKREMEAGNAYCDDFWSNNKWEDRTHDLDFLIERFWPVPDWPEDRGKW